MIERMFHFKTLKTYKTTKYKESVIQNKILNVAERVKTGIPEEIITHQEEIWLPMDKLEKMTSFDGKYKINEWEVSKEVFYQILEKCGIIYEIK